MNQTRPVATRAPLIVDPAILAEDPHRCIGEMLARLEMQEVLVARIAADPGHAGHRLQFDAGGGGIRQITPTRVCIPEFQ